MSFYDPLVHCFPLLLLCLVFSSPCDICTSKFHLAFNTNKLWANDKVVKDALCQSHLRSLVLPAGNAALSQTLTAETSSLWAAQVAVSLEFQQAVNLNRKTHFYSIGPDRCIDDTYMRPGLRRHYLIVIKTTLVLLSKIPSSLCWQLKLLKLQWVCVASDKCLGTHSPVSVTLNKICHLFSLLWTFYHCLLQASSSYSMCTFPDWFSHYNVINKNLQAFLLPSKQKDKRKMIFVSSNTFISASAFHFQTAKPDTKHDLCGAPFTSSIDASVGRLVCIVLRYGLDQSERACGFPGRTQVQDGEGKKC